MGEITLRPSCKKRRTPYHGALVCHSEREVFVQHKSFSQEKTKVIVCVRFWITVIKHLAHQRSTGQRVFEQLQRGWYTRLMCYSGCVDVIHPRITHRKRWWKRSNHSAQDTQCQERPGLKRPLIPVIFQTHLLLCWDQTTQCFAFWDNNCAIIQLRKQDTMADRILKPNQSQLGIYHNFRDMHRWSPDSVNNTMTF